MKRLRKYRHSDLMNIKINYGGKVYHFNLFEELLINEDIINAELKDQPSSFAFISLLQKKLQTKFEELKQERRRMYAQLYIRAKEKQNGNRLYTDEMAKSYALKHKLYKDITERCIKAKDDADILYSCVTAFLQRKDVLQTLSANSRKENH